MVPSLVVTCCVMQSRLEVNSSRSVSIVGPSSFLCRFSKRIASLSPSSRCLSLLAGQREETFFSHLLSMEILFFPSTHVLTFCLMFLQVKSLQLMVISLSGERTELTMISFPLSIQLYPWRTSWLWVMKFAATTSRSWDIVDLSFPSLTQWQNNFDFSLLLQDLLWRIRIGNYQRICV